MLFVRNTIFQVLFHSAKKPIEKKLKISRNKLYRVEVLSLNNKFCL